MTRWLAGSLGLLLGGCLASVSAQDSNWGIASPTPSIVFEPITTTWLFASCANLPAQLFHQISPVQSQRLRIQPNHHGCKVPRHRGRRRG